MRAGTFKLKENWELKTVNKFTGEVLQREEVVNDIVNTGLESLAKLLNGVSSTYQRAIAIGTNNTAVTTTDTTLNTELSRELADLSYEADYKAVFSKTFTFGSGVEADIVEAGIFDNSTSGGLMLSRTVFTAKSVSSAIDFKVTATITVSKV